MPPLPRTTAASSPGTKGASLAQPQPAEQVSHGSQVSRAITRTAGATRTGAHAGPLAEAVEFLATYIVLPRDTLTVVVAWVAAAHLTDVWDRFPHLAITSPEKRCGKTRFLQLLELLLPNPHNTANISPAAIWRLIEKCRPTLILDEAQSISRLGSESAEVTREILNSAIDRNAAVIRCVGKDHEPKAFSVYCPKVVALIGELDGVLADRCLPVEMKRKTEDEASQPIRSRVVEPLGHAIRDRLGEWAEANRDRIALVYDTLDTFDISNDRMAELLLPLQAVCVVDAELNGVAGLGGFTGEVPTNGGTTAVDVLRCYARDLEVKENSADRMSPGVRLLTCCRVIFNPTKNGKPAKPVEFLPTADLIAVLVAMPEEGWAHFTRGKSITPEALANLLKPYGIKSQRNRDQTARGYFAFQFKEAWSRYLTTAPAKPSNAQPGASPTAPGTPRKSPANPANSTSPARPNPKPGSFAEAAARRKAGGS